MSRYLFVSVVVALLILVACAPAATPTPEAMRQNAPTVDAMMNGSPTASAMMPAPTTDTMMPKATPTGDAMMTIGTPTGDAMMAPTADAMMPKATPTGDAMMTAKTTPTPAAMMDKMPAQMNAPHFVESSPKQGDVLPKLPELVSVSFNVPLGAGSTITITKDNAPVNTGKTTLDAKMLSMSASLPATTGDGLYLVHYKACWQNQTCDDGQFAFQVGSGMSK